MQFWQNISGMQRIYSIIKTRISTNQHYKSKMLSRPNVYKYTCANIRRRVCRSVRAHVYVRIYVCICVCVTKDRKRVACTARIDAYVSACASNGLPPLWNTHLHTTGAITTHTPAIKYHARVCLSYFSP